jgi:molybdate transport system substrate-binding protein
MLIWPQGQPYRPNKERKMRAKQVLIAAAITFAAGAGSATAADIKVLTAGAYKQVVLALQPTFEKQTGHKLIIENDTNGALVKRIDGGDAFDVAVISPASVDDLTKKGKIAAGSRVNLARVGIGVMVKEGAPKPDISSVDAFKKSLLAAKSVAYIDPASGGSSGIYLSGLFEKLGIANDIKSKAKLIHGGLVAEHIAKGEAEVGIHQISEIVPAKGVTLVGPLPAAIQNYTTYAAGLSAASKVSEPAQALIKVLSGPQAEQVLKSKGMAPAS